MMSSFLEKISFSNEEMALDAIADIVAVAHFLGTQQTLDLFKKAFYASLLSDWSNY